MNQSRFLSLLEASINVVIGFAVSYLIGLVVYPLYGFNASGTKVFTITLIFTVASLARMYAIRRFFNNRVHELALLIQRKIKEVSQS